MNPKFLQLEERHRTLQDRLAESAGRNAADFLTLGREFKRLESAVAKIGALRRVEADLAQAATLLQSSEADLRALAEEETRALEDRRSVLEKQLEEFLIPRDPRDDRDGIVEIRAGTGGDEAAIFVGDLYRMYARYAQDRGFALEPYSSSPTGLGGYKDITFGIKGDGAYGVFKFESGVHRVQRVPATEASGRVHTSTATVAVLPEADEVDVSINPVDLRIDVYRASGAGGQHVNKTESAVRITHLPTGVVVACQDERSQMKNRAKALTMLRAKLYQAEQERLEAERRHLRRAQVGTGERHEKIRTYNFPQDRITDHRINENFHNLPRILEGHMQDIHGALAKAEKAERLAQLDLA
ncbi:MAG: peptide chain release factor 1 [Elusimicrobia bacterium]|jgi:peptide chain release factor 1|nr:peptide chain release factor 1 [Elusimicrobiota bacterium]MBK7207862.1 peptide chain release factor 1 [Elusimicrobiota bacterium]MBK7544624.1 peptide chain release factor 1 [Elusimicrobiota bacterium]MBK7574156.1 peptide chain release factor 1 [Elusimicrobiota bacterium]MBK7688903.1 peptide chain release factor 1 [Elusimicrobiota bacterium]